MTNKKHNELKEIWADVKCLEKIMKSASFKKLSKYSQNLIKADYSKAIERQIQLIAQEL